MCEWCSGWCTSHCTKYTKRCKMVQLVHPVRAENCRLETRKSLRTCRGLRVQHRSSHIQLRMRAPIHRTLGTAHELPRAL